MRSKALEVTLKITENGPLCGWANSQLKAAAPGRGGRSRFELRLRRRMKFVPIRCFAFLCRGARLMRIDGRRQSNLVMACRGRGRVCANRGGTCACRTRHGNLPARQRKPPALNAPVERDEYHPSGLLEGPSGNTKHRFAAPQNFFHLPPLAVKREVASVRLKVR